MARLKISTGLGTVLRAGVMGVAMGMTDGEQARRFARIGRIVIDGAEDGLEIELDERRATRRRTLPRRKTREGGQ